MATNNLNALAANLEEQQALLASQAESLRSELTGIEDGLARIKAALAALTGPRLPAQRETAPGKKRSKTGVPSVSKATVIELISQELTQTKSIEESNLKSRVEKLVIASGHNRSGFSLRFSEALSDARFQKHVNGISLKSHGSRLTS